MNVGIDYEVAKKILSFVAFDSFISNGDGKIEHWPPLPPIL